MAGSPQWKVYNSGGVYIASCKHIEDAAALVAVNGPGATIRHSHGKPLWTEGAEDFPAGESYDRVFDVVMERHHERMVAAYTKTYGYPPPREWLEG